MPLLHDAHGVAHAQRLEHARAHELRNGHLRDDLDQRGQRVGALIAVGDRAARLEVELITATELRDGLIGCGRDLLCRELRELERYILLQIYDSLWKDHMYAMDLLRSGIGLRGYAEKDPKIEYKREGTRLFSEMLENVRERVTDLVFRAQIAGGGAEALTGGGEHPIGRKAVDFTTRVLPQWHRGGTT